MESSYWKPIEVRASWHFCLQKYSPPSNFSVAAAYCPYKLITSAPFILSSTYAKGSFFLSKMLILLTISGDPRILLGEVVRQF